MPYVTSVERLAKEEGREEGRVEGSASILREVLVQQFGDLSEDIETRIRQLSLEQGLALSRIRLNFHSLAELEIWLKNAVD